MHSKTDPPARRSEDFDLAATTAMDSVLRNAARLRTMDDRKRDQELALYVEVSLINRRPVPKSQGSRDFDDGWLHGVALAARTMHEQQRATHALRIDALFARAQ